MRRISGVVACAALVLGSILVLTPAVAEAAGTPTINAFAGTENTTGPSGNGGPATSATLANPSDVAVSPVDGSAYIADFFSCQVRSVAGGIINAFAGNAATCNAVVTVSGVPGPATSATIGGTTGVAVDSSGNVFVAACDDYTATGNGCTSGAIYKVTTNGTISTFVSAAQMGARWGSGNGAPWGVRVAGGYVYFSDVVDNVVDRIPTTGGSLTVVAGNGTAGFTGGAATTTAQLSDPTGLFVDGSGNVFVADTHNYAIREVSDGVVSTIAGTGSQGSAANPPANAQATQTALVNPFGVVEDSSGNVLVADYGASCILKVTAGVISTWGGTCDGNPVSGSNGVAVTATTLGGPSNLAFDASGNLYVVEYDGQVVRVVSSAELIPPTTPTISNLPSAPVFGGSFKASVSTNGDGVKSVRSSTPAICTVGANGLTVSFVAAGTCSLTAEVAAGTNYAAATGSAQTVTVGKATPTPPSIANLPTAATVGHSFVADVVTNGDGTTSVSSNSPAVCTVGPDSVTVSFVATGTCSLTPEVNAGTDYTAATGTAQTFTVTPVTSPGGPSRGYWLVASDGGVFNYGDAGFFGSAGSVPLNKPIVGMAATPDGKGYWLVASDGGIFNYGDAGFYGSAGSVPLNKSIVGMAATPDGKGYWLVASDGGIFNYGDAGFYGSAGSVPLNKPIVGMAATPDGKGYWLVASDGGIFNYGDSKFFGSAGSIPLNKPIVGMAASPTGKGYWLVASDGGIFNYGDAGFYGSSGSIQLNRPIVGMASTPAGKGYWLVASDGGIFNYGDAGFQGSTGNLHLNHPVIGMAPGL